METDTTNKQPAKDKSLENLERMLEKIPEGSRKPILDLINKRKVELGLLKSELKPAGYILKKRRGKPKPKPQTKESMESLRKIAKGVGRVTETRDIVPKDIDVRDEPLKKEKKTLEEVDSYKY